MNITLDYIPRFKRLAVRDIIVFKNIYEIMTSIRINKKYEIQAIINEIIWLQNLETTEIVWEQLDKVLRSNYIKIN